eukprot:CAMPEP_0183340262 /NCGR_PEP_ID=MMETSP0164_2-20130417/6873_1 /TAXON_ID=221442 /ORGANISM="Coccolithus pelagicus ssp braarudi, Strain PLY182g" /LENGTH=415 /DNA_ID=CAMNT_0025510377 /DNA_START=18 /DNA_END=1265 /DNA_ORIENTATION=+
MTRLAHASARVSASTLRICARPLSTAVTSGTTGVFPLAPSPLQEFSVVYTDRALNHMSEPFKKVMLDMGNMFKDVYNAEHCVLIPGSGTYGMEAVARQWATNEKVMVIRNGYFSFRWTDIFEWCNIPKEHIVVQAQSLPSTNGVPHHVQYQPCPIDELEEMIAKEKPAVLFAPHVETSTGIILPDNYIQRASAAVHKVGGMMVLDCIASGTVWVDMESLGIDALITAPQKGWTGPACAGVVLLSKRGGEHTRNTKSTSLCCNLGKWLEVMDSYEAGGFSYHTTMPTDALVVARDAMELTRDFGYEKASKHAWALGGAARELMAAKGLISVAAPGFESPGVVVVHHDDGAVAGKFVAAGTQIAAGVPFKLGEHPDTKTFRIGLFGLDKLRDPEQTVANLKKAMDIAVPDEPLAASA